jgi:glycine/D-amino acid oxidase-like deaminating enzyme
MNGILAPSFRNEPYWWDRARPEPIEAPEPAAAYDVVVVGSGFTGLRAALTLLRAGRSVAVFDKEAPGAGASRRNAGYLGRVLKKSFEELCQSRSQAQALAIYRELDAAYQTTLAFIAAEGIDCHAGRCGRFIGATSPRHYERLARQLESMKRHLGFPYHMIARAEQHQEIASDVYHGGAVIPDLGALHPGLYHQGLLDRVRSAGGLVRGPFEVLDIRRGPAEKSFEVVTAGGSVQARDVVLATNGYTPSAFAWHARRLIPFTGYVAATEALAPALIEKVLPRRRTVIDTNMDIDFFRPAPDSPRILFGGATGSGLVERGALARRLHEILARVLPDLAGARLERIWTGRCAATFDLMPHIGQAEGIWHAMGYNFAGVPMGSYFGLKIAQKILGLPEGKTAFDSAPFPTMPFYRGNPWFVPLAMRYFRWQDRRLAR